MLDSDSDPDIPTLTIKSEEDSLPPTLTDIAAATGTAAPSETVLRALLQAEIDRAVHTALDEALARIRDRLDAQIPEIVARVLRTARPG